MNTFLLSGNIILAYSAYAIGTASPGPSNFAIMNVAMNFGRKSALIFAFGVVCGSLFWGILAACGLSAILAEYSQLLAIMKVCCGLYLFWLALKSAKSALFLHRIANLEKIMPRHSAKKLFFQGVTMHLTNPKAIFVWLSIVTLALPMQIKLSEALTVIAGCAPIGIIVFCTYAILFSTKIAQNTYRQSKRWFDGTLALLFGYAGFKILTSKI